MPIFQTLKFLGKQCSFRVSTLTAQHKWKSCAPLGTAVKKRQKVPFLKPISQTSPRKEQFPNTYTTSICLYLVILAFFQGSALRQDLKVQQHEIVDFWFFSIIDPIWAPDSHPKIFSNSVSNSWRFSDFYVYQRCRTQRCRTQR